MACSRELFNVVMLGLGFLLIMGGYSPVQNFATSLLNLPCLAIGSFSIGLIYAALAIAALLAPVAIRRLGERTAMILTSLAYCTYVVSVAWIITPVVILTSINIGLCGGVLNTAGGSFLAKNCDDTNRGQFSGIFNAFNMGSAIPGNLLSIFFLSTSGATAGSGSDSDATSGLTSTDDTDPHCGPGTTWRDRINLGWDGSSSEFFLALAVMCLAGTGALCLIRPSPRGQALNEAEEPAESSREIIAKTLSLLTAPVMRPLILLFLYSGLSNAYWSGMLPGQVDTAMVGPAMVVVGVAEVCGGLVYGRMIDCVGAKRTLCAVLLQNLCALGLSVVANLPSVRDSTSVDLTSEHLFYVASFLLGAADNGLMTCIYAIVSATFENQGEAAASPKERLLESVPAGGAARHCADDAFALLMCLNSVMVMVVFLCQPLLVTNDDAPQLLPGAFLGETVFVGAWEAVAVLCAVCWAQ